MLAAYVPDAREKAALREVIFWRLSNPAMAALIGGALEGVNGALAGFFLGVVLVMAPDFVRPLPEWARRAFRQTAPMRAALWRLAPQGLRDRIKERRQG